MKIAALHDSKGRILAAVHLTPNYKGPVPVAGKGSKYMEVDVPDHHAKAGLLAVCQNFKINTKTREIVALKAGGKKSKT